MIRKRNKAFYLRGTAIFLATLVTTNAAMALAKHTHVYTPLPPGSPPYPGYDSAGAFLTALVILAARLPRPFHSFLLSVWLILLFATSTVLHWNPGYGILLTAAGSIIIGLFKLRRFLKENPVLEGEANGSA